MGGRAAKCEGLIGAGWQAPDSGPAVSAMAQAVRAALLGHPCQRHNCLPHGQARGGIICAYPAGLAGRHPELVPHEPPAAAVQDGRTPHPACPVLHPATCRKLLDGEPLSSDSSAHRAARMASDVIESSTRERRR